MENVNETNDATASGNVDDSSIAMAARHTTSARSANNTTSAADSRNTSNAQPLSDLPTLKVIAQLQRKQITAADLPKNTRLEVVNHLSVHGYSVAEIAVILDVADRTVVRDRARLRQRNAVYADAVGLAGQLVGIFTQQTEASVERLRTMQRDKTIKPGVRVQAEQALSVIMDRFLRRLQSLGYLPTLDKQQATERTKPEPAQLASRTERMQDDLRRSADLPGNSPQDGMQLWNQGDFGRRAELLARFDDGSVSRKQRRRIDKLMKRKGKQKADQQGGASGSGGSHARSASADARVTEIPFAPGVVGVETEKLNQYLREAGLQPIG